MIFKVSLALLVLGFQTATLRAVDSSDTPTPKKSKSKSTDKSKGSDSPKKTPAATPAPAEPAGPKISFTEFHVGDSKAIALTFDDGPHPKNTPRLLEMLKERGIKATFFLIGKSAATYPDVAKRIVEEGHEVGNHTWTHPQLTHLSDAKVIDELQKTEDAIKGATGVTPTFFRPPYGSLKLSQKKWIYDRFHYKAIIWDVDTLDWKVRNATKVHDTILKETHSGSIILCHDIHETTIDAMPATLDELKAKGFEFKTISEMIALDEATAKAKASPTPAAAAPQPAAGTPPPPAAEKKPATTESSATELVPPIPPKP